MEHSATISFLVLTGPSATNDGDVSVEISETEEREAEHQVYDDLQSTGIAESAAIATISEPVAPPVVTEKTSSEADNVGAIATLSIPPKESPKESALVVSEQDSAQVLFESTADDPKPQGSESDESEDIEPEDTELGSSDEQLWDELDDALFEEGANGNLMADESSEGTAPGPSAIQSAEAPAVPAPEPAPEPLAEQSLDSAQSPLSLRKAGWSSLPVEIREKIYKELLLVDMRQEQNDLSHHRLHPNILRANRDIYLEASNILYLRNTWVRIRMHREVKRHVEDSINDCRHRKGRPEVLLHPITFPSVAALHIVVYYKDTPDLPKQTCIFSSFAMPQVCRTLGRDYLAAIGLELDAATAPEGAMWDRKGLLDCFVETRGLESLKYTKSVAMLAEGRGKDGLVQLGAIVLPLNNPAEVLERALTYLNRGRQQVRAKHMYEALTTFQEGTYYVHWLAYNPYDMSSERIEQSQIHIQLKGTWWDLIEECLSCCMQLGDITWARKTLLSLFQGAYEASPDKWAEAYHELGLIEETLGAENAAAYSFLRALYASPGHEATQNAIDRLRERVDDKIDVERVIVRHNIDNVLKPFQDRTANQSPLNREEARKVIARFVGQIHELDMCHEYTDSSQNGLVAINI